MLRLQYFPRSNGRNVNIHCSNQKMDGAFNLLLSMLSFSILYLAICVYNIWESGRCFKNVISFYWCCISDLAYFELLWSSCDGGSAFFGFWTQVLKQWAQAKCIWIEWQEDWAVTIRRSETTILQNYWCPNGFEQQILPFGVIY